MGAEASQCSCSSTRFCNLASDQGSSVVQSEYEPQRAGFQEESEALPSKQTQAELQAAERSTLPSSFEYVPDQRSASPKAAPKAASPKAASPAAAALSAVAASPGNGQPVSEELKAQVVQKLQTALETACADIRELETLLEEARQASVDVPEVKGLERRVRALRAIENINQAAAARNAEKLGRAIDDARAAGVPEAQLSKAVQMLEGLRAERQQRQESDRRGTEKRKQENALACLQRAVDERDLEKLSLALAGAEREGVPAKDLEAGKKLLADLRHDGEKRSGSTGTSMFRRKPKT